MKKNKKLILIELNELNFDLVKKYSNKYKLKFFNQALFQNLKYSKSETEYHKLEPWIQWVSAHTGQSADEHKIFRLGDIKNKNKKIIQIFEKVEELGYSVGAISPMNTTNQMKNPLYFISDPWTAGGEDKNFFHTMLANGISRAVNSNSEGKILIKDYFIFILAIIKFARIKNYFHYFKYFFKCLRKKWYKAIFLDFFLNDIHLSLIDKFKPDFSCIFFNAGAHIQHHYFFNSEFNKNNLTNPNWYIDNKSDPLKDAIFFYDNLLYEYSNFEDYEILIATGLTQIPYDRKKFYYRIKNHENFLKKCQIKYNKVLPRMTRDFALEFSNEQQCMIAQKQIDDINNLNKKKIFQIDNRGKSLFITLVISEEISEFDYLYLRENIKIKIIDYVNFVALKNGMHDQKGFIYFTNDEFYISSDNLFHVKEIHNIILNYFKN